MPKNKHLTFEQRLTIQEMLHEKKSFRDIAASLGKDPSTISKEIRRHCIRRRTGSMHRSYNSCANRFKCQKTHLCYPCHSERKYKLCSKCSMCNSFCGDFRREDCRKLSKPPYVCNGCASKPDCTLEKSFYDAKAADRAYRELLSEGRSGISLSEEELQYLDSIVSPLIKNNQSPHHICTANRDFITVSERTIYRYVDSKILSVLNLDLQRKVRFRARKKTVTTKVDKKCRIGRTYQDFLSYMEEHPDIPVTELDSVEGKKGGKVLLTIHFKKAEMMLSFIRDHNDSASVINIFESLYQCLGRESFMRIFKVCLADNGSEFSNPAAIEFDKDGLRRTHIFYCDPNAPFQKGSAERNHEFIRLFIQKGKDMAPYSQADISSMMDHINSYARESLADKCPYDVFSYLYGDTVLNLLGCRTIEPAKVTLNNSIFRKEADHEI